MGSLEAGDTYSCSVGAVSELCYSLIKQDLSGTEDHRVRAIPAMALDSGDLDPENHGSQKLATK